MCGAGGMLGSDVVRAAAAAGHEVVALARADLDVTDEEAVRRAVAEAAPDAVVNCAAWTDVDGAEEHAEEAMAVNGLAPGHLARAASAAEAVLVHVSTDYVFDGRRMAPYVESDPTSPLSEYGRTKLEGERRVAADGPRHVIARSAWLFGAGGANFVETMLRLGAERDEVRVVADQVGSPTWTGHLAPALLELAGGGRPGLHHVAAAGECSRHEQTVEALGQAGVECRVLPATSDEFPRPAARPAYSALASERPDAVTLPDWREGIAGYLADRAAGTG